MSEYGYLAHHGVKGQKWGVRKQRPTGNGRVYNPKRPSPDRRKAIAIGVLATLGTAALAGGTVAAAKNPEAVKRALGSIGGAFAKIPRKMYGRSANDMWKGTAKQSAKVFKQNMKEQRKAAAKKFVKNAPKKVKNTIKEVSSNTVKGVWDGLKGAGKEFSSKENIEALVKENVKKGANFAVGAAITGGIGLAAKSAISGRKPTRDQVTAYMTANPNKKK